MFIANFYVFDLIQLRDPIANQFRDISHQAEFAFERFTDTIEEVLEPPDRISEDRMKKIIEEQLDMVQQMLTDGKKESLELLRSLDKLEEAILNFNTATAPVDYGFDWIASVRYWRRQLVLHRERRAREAKSKNAEKEEVAAAHREGEQVGYEKGRKEGFDEGYQAALRDLELRKAKEGEGNTSASNASTRPPPLSTLLVNNLF